MTVWRYFNSLIVLLLSVLLWALLGLLKCVQLKWKLHAFLWVYLLALIESTSQFRKCLFYIHRSVSRPSKLPPRGSFTTLSGHPPGSQASKPLCLCEVETNHRESYWLFNPQICCLPPLVLLLLSPSLLVVQNGFPSFLPPLSPSLVLSAPRPQLWRHIFPRVCVQTLHDTVSAPAGHDFSPCRRLIQCYYLYHLGREREGKGGLEWH